jgi:DNA-binding transcriptional MocR family regulator
MLLELPQDGPDSSALVEAARRRSIEVFALGPSFHDGRAPRDGIVLGYGALAEHEFEAGIRALGDLLADLLPA